MLRLSSILQLQSVWDTIPSQSSPTSSPATLSRSDSVQAQSTTLTSAISLVLEGNLFSTSTSSITSLPERPPSPPTPSVSPSSSVQADDSQLPAPVISVFHDVDQIHPLATNTTDHLLEPPQKNTIKISHISANNNDTTALPSPPPPPPPPVPSKDPSHRFNVIPSKPSKTANKISDNVQPTAEKTKKKEKRSSKYGIFGSRSFAAAPPTPPPTSSMMPSPSPSPPPNQVIDGANKTLRRETSKFNLRRKSLSKKVKRAISSIKLNGTGDTTLPPPLPPTLS
ncbi:hypothetical protein BCR42DRAFT_422317, partial [Absidia repens]